MRDNSTLYYYHAFGLTVCSEIEIVMLDPDEEIYTEPDVSITLCHQADLWQECRNGGYFIKPGDIRFYVDGCAGFRIQNGSHITVSIENVARMGELSVYIMGSCFGAILHQRGYLPIHGSCVSDGKKAILITGDSGAGKSTLAAEFLSRGWQLLTDDVAVIVGIEERMPRVQSSYPSQKLWEDAISRYQRDEKQTSLFQEERREKFNIQVRAFKEGQAALKHIVRLAVVDAEALGDENCFVQPVTGFPVVNQFMYNTYRIFMVPEEHRQKHFQRCVDLSQLVPMSLAVRVKGANSAPDLYAKLVAVVDAQPE